MSRKSAQQCLTKSLCGNGLGFGGAVGARIRSTKIHTGTGVMHYRLTTPHGCRVLFAHK